MLVHKKTTTALKNTKIHEDNVVVAAAASYN